MQSYLQYKRIGISARQRFQHVDDPARVATAHETATPENHDLEQQEKGPKPMSHGLSVSEAARKSEANLAQDPEFAVMLVDWEGPDDPDKPRNWPLGARLVTTILISLIATALSCATGIDAAILPQAAADFGVSRVAESLSTGMFLIGQGVGSLVAGPFSETFGRNVVYTGSVIVFMVWMMAGALAPNFGAQITFRFFAGCCASAPLTCCGGSVSDMFDPLEKTWAFPFYAVAAFGGPMLGAVMGAYIGPSTVVSWRWAEWTMLILSGVVFVSILLFMPETYGPILLKWKASHLRKITNDVRYRSELEVRDTTLFDRIKVSMTRPFIMLTEPIILAVTLYLSLVYMVIFTFLVGWPYIFEYTYQIGQGPSNIKFIAIFAGIQLTYFLIPVVWRITKRDIKRALSSGEPFEPEIRLWYGMLGASVAIPVSLFWIGATARPDIGAWSPTIAAVLFGYGIMGIFICIYMYVIDTYEAYSASALTFASFVRYTCAGALTVAGIPMYSHMGAAHALYLLGGISLLLAPIPFAFFKWGHLLRKNSRYAASLTR